MKKYGSLASVLVIKLNHPESSEKYFNWNPDSKLSFD